MYALTEMAQELHQSLLELTDWARRHGSAVAAAQAAYDREQIPALPGFVREIKTFLPNGPVVSLSGRIAASRQAARRRTVPTPCPTLRSWLPAAIWVTP